MKHFAAVLLAMAGCLAILCPEPTSGNDFVPRPAVIRTNWVDHWVTNTTEIQLQLNRFVTEYHTNATIHFHTNYVDLFTTNLVSRTVTNMLVLDAVQTNFVQAYQTNLKTLNLTNWTTVLAFRTNWVTKPLTNLVEIETPREAVPSRTAASSSPALDTEPLAMQATRSLRLTNGNQIEVQLTVTWKRAPATPVQVQQWRIEREDGSFLCFGQDPQFKRALPAGTYKVSVKAQRDAKSPLLAVLGTLTVTPREVLLEQHPTRSNSSI
jgi:hypothetical protein